MFANVGPLGEPGGRRRARPARGGARIRVALDRRARRGAVGLRVAVPVLGRREDARAARVADPRPADLADVRRRGHDTHPARHRHPDPPAAQPARAREGGRDASTACRAGGSTSASASAGCARSSTRSASRSSGAARAPTSTSTCCAGSGASRTPRFTGEFTNFADLNCYPKPAGPDGVPIHVGGHTEAAARRAGRLGDGFFPGAARDDASRPARRDARRRRPTPGATPTRSRSRAAVGSTSTPSSGPPTSVSAASSSRRSASTSRPCVQLGTFADNVIAKTAGTPTDVTRCSRGRRRRGARRRGRCGGRSSTRRRA